MFKRPQRRRIRNTDGFGISEKQAEGRTIEVLNNLFFCCLILY